MEKNWPGGFNSHSQEATPWFLWGIPLWSNQFPGVWAHGESGHESVLKHRFFMASASPLPAQSSPWWSAVLLPGIRAELAPWGFVPLPLIQSLFFFPYTGDPVQSTAWKGWERKARTWDKSILEKTSLSSSVMCLKLIGWKRYLLKSSFWPLLSLQGDTAGIQVHPSSKAQSKSGSIPVRNNQGKNTYPTSQLFFKG